MRRCLETSTSRLWIVQNQMVFRSRWVTSTKTTSSLLSRQYGAIISLDSPNFPSTMPRTKTWTYICRICVSRQSCERKSWQKIQEANEEAWHGGCVEPDFGGQSDHELETDRTGLKRRPEEMGRSRGSLGKLRSVLQIQASQISVKIKIAVTFHNTDHKQKSRLERSNISIPTPTN